MSMRLSTARRTSVRARRLLAAPVLAGLLLVAGCGTESASDEDAGTDVGSAGAASTDPVPPSEPTASATAETGSEDAPVGEVLVDATLGVDALEFTGSTTGGAMEVTNGEDLLTAYPDVPGVEAVVAQLEATPPTADERVFVYTVAACSMDDLSLRLQGNELMMVVSGTATIKCEPPPVHMVVWTVPADELPADVVAGQAIQK